MRKPTPCCWLREALSYISQYLGALLRCGTGAFPEEAVPPGSCSMPLKTLLARAGWVNSQNLLEVPGQIIIKKKKQLKE